jgi:hypothetical protein
MIDTILYYCLDFGVHYTFIISGKEINTWLNNDRNLALLPDLLQQQIKLGRQVQEGMGINSNDKVIEIVGTVLSRNPTWLNFYGENINKGVLDNEQRTRALDAEERLTKAAKAEAEYARAFWDGDYPTARSALEDTFEETARADTPLAGWHSIWLGACYEKEGDIESSRQAYRRDKKRLGVNVTLPLGNVGNSYNVEQTDSPFETFVKGLISLNSQNSFRRQIGIIERQLTDLDGATPRQMEEAVRSLGEVLGFEATRPDNDEGTGPDVLWISTENKQCLAFELKTDKDNPATYYKKDVSQAADSINWVENNKKGITCLGFIFIGPDGKCSNDANPSPKMWLCHPRCLAELRNEIIAMVYDLRKLLPQQHAHKTREKCVQPCWTLDNLFEQLRSKSLLDMKT